MRMSPLSTAQLGTAWLTGAALVLGAWWALNSWEAQRNALIQIEMTTMKTALQRTGQIPISDTTAIKEGFANVGQLQNEVAADLLAFAKQRQTIRPIVTILTVLVVVALLSLTWQWANSRKPAAT